MGLDLILAQINEMLPKRKMQVKILFILYFQTMLFSPRCRMTFNRKKLKLRYMSNIMSELIDNASFKNRVTNGQ